MLEAFRAGLKVGLLRRVERPSHGVSWSVFVLSVRGDVFDRPSFTASIIVLIHLGSRGLTRNE